MRHRVGTSLMVIGALTLLPVAFLATRTAAFPEPPTYRQVPEGAASPGADLAEKLVYPAITIEQADWMTEAQEAVEDDPDYVSLAIALDRKSISVTWFGTPSLELESLLADGPPDTELRVIPSPHPGGQLRAMQADAWEQEFVGFRIVTSSVNPDGSGIVFDVVSEGSSQDQARHDVVAAIGSGEIPITVNLVTSGPIAL